MCTFISCNVLFFFASIGHKNRCWRPKTNFEIKRLSCKILERKSLSCKILERKSVSCKILERKSVSCKILVRKKFILQDLARFWKKFLQDDASSCKILPESCKILQDKLFFPTRVLKVLNIHTKWKSI